VCYKPDMRKWMRDRLKRRKKEPQQDTAESKPAPLQPAFYDTEPASAATQVEPPEAENAEPAASAESEAGQSTRAAGGDAAAQPRRRRGRGGRGRRKPVSRQRAATQVDASSVTPMADAAAPAEAAETVPAVSENISAQPATPRPPKGTVVLAIGLPGSGKSSWFKRHQITPLSSDLLRTLLFDDPTEQRFQDLIFSNLRSMLKARLIARRPLNYVDATNLTSHDRHGWIKLAKDYGYEVQAVYFDVPVETCLERNRKRERTVPEDVMRRMAGKLKPPTFEEGFSKITVVRVKQKE
jgi:predicted kinase